MKTRTPLFRIDRLLIAALSLLAAPQVQAQFNLTNTNYTQNFNALGTNNFTNANRDLGALSNALTGWYWYETQSNSNNILAVNNGSSGTGDTYNFGATGGSDRSLGSVQSSSLISSWGFWFSNSLGATITNLRITYTGETWRIGATNRTDVIDFSYSGTNTNLAAATWTNFDGLDYTNTASATTVTTAQTAPVQTASISNNLSVSISAGGTFFIRWSDFNATGTDDGLSIDDFSMTAFLEAVIAALNWAGGSGSWDTGFGGTVTNGSALSFSGSGGIATNNLVNPLIASMTFSNGAGSYTIAGNAFTISNNIINNSASLQTFSNNITLGAAASFSASAGAMTFAGNIDTGVNVLNIAGSSNTIVSGVISGSAGLTKSGLGTLTLNNANTFTGNITNNGGVISVDNDSELGNSANDIVFGGLGTGTLQSTASFAMSAGRDISGTGTLDIASGTTLTNSGTVNMTALTLANAGTFEMSGASKTLNSLTFSVASTLTNTGAAAVIGGNVAANNANGTVVMAGAYDIGAANRTFTVTNGSAAVDMQITGALTNTTASAYLVKAGTGRLEISGNNSGLAGGLQLGSAGSAAAGELVVTSKEALGQAQFRLNSGTFIASTALTGANAITNNLSIGGRAANAAIIGGTNATEFTGGVSWFGAASTASTLQVNNATTLSGVIASGNTNGVTFEFAGTGSLTLSGASGNTFTNAVTISNTGLTVIVGKNDAFGTTASGTTLQSGSTILLNGVNYSTAEALTINGTGIGGSGALRSAGTSTFAGVVTAGATATIAADAGSTFTLSGGISGGANTVTVGGAGDVIVSGAISSGNISKGGNGNLTISNTNSSFGTLTTGTGGTVIGTNAAITGLAGSGALNLAGGTLTVNNSAAQSFSGAITGAGGLTKSSAGTLTLSGAGSYSGATVVSGGTLLAGANNVFSANSAFTVGSAGVLGILDLNGTTQTVTNLTLLGSSASGRTNRVEIGAGGTLTVNGTVQYETGEIGNWPGQINGGTLDLGGETRTFLVYSNDNSTTGGDLQISSVIANGGINKTQNGILRLSGANTLGGTVLVSAGELQLYNTNALQNATLDAGSAGNQFVSFNTNGTFTYNIGALSGADNIALGANRISVGGNNSNSTYSGILSGTGGLTKAGNGTFTLSGANSYSGGTVVSGGRLVGSTATLQGPITNTAAVTFNQSTNGTYGNVMSGVGGTLTKSGLGTLTMTNVNTFSGATTIEAGLLLVNGTNANSAVTVNSSASLGGSGRVGDLTVSGLLAPGNSIGTLSAGNTTFNTNGSFELEIYNFGGTAGTDWDRLIVDSTLTLSNTTANPFTINLVSMSSSTTAGAALFNPNLSYTNQFVNYTTLSGSFDASAFNVSLLNFTNFTAINGTFSITNTGTGLALLYLTSYVPPSVFDWNTGSGEWSDNNAWVGGVAPTDGADISFSGAGGQSTNNTITSIAGLTFSNGAGSYAISGTAAMTNGSGGIVNNSSNNQTINNDLILGAVQTFNAASGDITIGGAVDNNGNPLTVDGAANVAINGAISDAGGVTKIGSGSLTLGGNNTFTGTLAANAGTVLVTGTQATTAINVGGGTLLLGANDVLANGATLSLNIGAVNLGTFSDTISIYSQVAGTITNGTLAAGTYNLTGGTMGATLSGGNINVGGNVSLSGTITNGSVSITNGALTLAGNDRISSDSTVTVNGSGATLNLGGFSDTISTYSQVAGTITNGSLAATTYNLSGGTMGATLSGGNINVGGNVSLSGSITNGSVSITNGTLTLAGNDRISSDSTVTVNGIGATLNLGGFSDTISTYSQVAGTITNGSLAATTYNLSGGTMGAGLNGGAVTVGGNVSLSGTITNGASVSITNGTLTYGSANRIGDNSTVTLNGSGATLNLGGFSDTISTYSQLAGTITNGTLTATTYALNGGTMGATLAATGTANVGGAVTLSGVINSALNINSGGTLTLAAADRIGSGSAVTVDGGTLATASFSDTVSSVVLTNNGSITGTGTLTAGAYTLNGGTVGANLGAGTATASAGTTALNGTLAGNLVVSGGTVNLGGANVISGSSTVNVSSGALNLNGDDSVGAVTLTGGTIGGSGVLTGTSYAVQGGTISAGLGGSGAFTKSGAATATLSGDNSTYSGAITVGNGTLLAASDSAFGIGAITVTNGSVLATAGRTISSGFTIGTAASQSAGTNLFIAGWDFQTTNNGGTAIAAAPSTPTTILANFGNQAGGASMLLNGSNGSSTWITATSGNELTAFGGTAINATNTFVSPSVTMSTTTSGAAALAIQATSANNKSIVFSLNMSNIASLELSYASQRTSTGFNSHLWEYSTDASNWTAFWTNSAIASSFELESAPSALTALSNSSTAYLRLTVSGSTGGNNRLDNILLNGVSIGAITAASGSGTLGITEAGTATFTGAITNNNAATFTAASGGTATFSGAISGAGSLSKTGLGTVTLSGDSANTFTGTTTVSAGTLQLNKTADITALASTNIIVSKVDDNNRAVLLLSAGGQVADSTAVTLSGGTITRASGVSEVFGNLNLTEASFLDFGTGDVGELKFGTYTSSALLTVNNFLPGNKLIFVGTDLSGSINNTSLFSFQGDFQSAWNSGNNTFTITAIPEPSTYLAAAGLLGLMLWPSRKRLIKDAKKILGLTAPMGDRLAAKRA